MNVLIIPEDLRKDQYILKPLITAMLDALHPTPPWHTGVQLCDDLAPGGLPLAAFAADLGGKR